MHDSVAMQIFTESSRSQQMKMANKRSNKIEIAVKLAAGAKGGGRGGGGGLGAFSERFVRVLSSCVFASIVNALTSHISSE